MTTPEGVTLPLEVVAPPMIPPERVVLQVGDLKLTAAQVDYILQAYPESQRVFVNGPGRAQFIDQLVRVLLLSQEGKRRKLNETEIYQNQLMYSAAGILASHTDEEVRRQARGDEAALKAYYEAHKSEWEEVHARHILIRTHGSAVSPAPGQKDISDEEGLAKALEIRQKILQGANFAELARTESADTASNSKGGDLGFLKRGQTVPSFDEAAFALPIGELSLPVKSAYGYHIIRVEERRPTRSFEELRPEIEKTIANQASRNFVEKLKADVKIVIDPEFNAVRNTTVELKR